MRGRTQDRSLFRSNAKRAQRERLLGEISIATPPSAHLALLVAITSLALLAVTAYAVEVPQRAQASGVLMPPQGLLTIPALESGRVTALLVEEGERVRRGTALALLSAGRDIPGAAPLSAAQLASLDNERSLLEESHAGQRRRSERRSLALRAQLAITQRRVAVAGQEVALQLQRSRLLRGRLADLEGLAIKGNVARHQVSAAADEHLRAQAAHAAGQQRLEQLLLEQRTLSETHNDLEHDLELESLRYRTELERLDRQRNQYQAEGTRQITAPVGAYVARLMVRPGASVLAGQPLLSLFRSNDPLEAWLYLPAAKAGLLKAGQEVLIQLDAYPYQVFGVQTAVITGISRTALLPSQLSVPLGLQGPVFEIRASLAAQSITAMGQQWQLSPGASFNADIVQRRFRLYQWLLRALWDEPLEQSPRA